jgi:hypothetical protein
MQEDEGTQGHTKTPEKPRKSVMRGRKWVNVGQRLRVALAARDSAHPRLITSKNGGIPSTIRTLAGHSRPAWIATIPEAICDES